MKEKTVTLWATFLNELEPDLAFLPNSSPPVEWGGVFYTKLRHLASFDEAIRARSDLQEFIKYYLNRMLEFRIPLPPCYTRETSIFFALDLCTHIAESEDQSNADEKVHTLFRYHAKGLEGLLEEGIDECFYKIIENHSDAAFSGFLDGIRPKHSLLNIHSPFPHDSFPCLTFAMALNGSRSATSLFSYAERIGVSPASDLLFRKIDLDQVSVPVLLSALHYYTSTGAIDDLKTLVKKIEAITGNEELTYLKQAVPGFPPSPLISGDQTLSLTLMEASLLLMDKELIDILVARGGSFPSSIPFARNIRDTIPDFLGAFRQRTYEKESAIYAFYSEVEAALDDF